MASLAELVEGGGSLRWNFSVGAQGCDQPSDLGVELKPAKRQQRLGIIH